MNILILSWRGPGHPNAGGAEIVTLEHASAWVKAGHDVILFTSFFKGAKKSEEVRGITVKRQGRQFLGVQMRAFIWYLFARHPKIDLIVDEIHGIPFFTPLYTRVRKIAFIHEVTKEVWKLNPWPKPMSLIPSFFGTLLEPYLFKLYKKVPFITVSESTRDDLVSWGIPKKNITVIYNGVHRTQVPRKLPQKEVKKTAVFLGALSTDKGVFDVPRVFAEIDRKDDNWQFWVVGYGTEEYVDKMKTLIRGLDIEKKYKYWGFVSERRKFELLARAHVLINTSVREGWSLVNIEANSVGIPVVGYDVAGVRNSIVNGKTGYLVPFGRFRELAEAARRVVDKRETYDLFRANALKWSKKFTWEKATTESLNLIESL